MRWTYNLNKSNVYLENKIIEEKMLLFLEKSSAPNILLIGESGIGKTELVAQFSKKYNILGVDIAGLISGTQYRGLFEEKMQELIEEAKEKKIILFFDEIHSLANTGSAEGGISALDILKPVLFDENFRVIGATTEEEYQILKKDKAFLRRFINIKVDKLSKENILSLFELFVSENSKKYKYKLDKKIILNYKSNVINSLNNNEKNIISKIKEDIDTIYCYFQKNKFETKLDEFLYIKK